MFKAITYLSLLVAGTAQHLRCTSTATNQLIVDLRKTINDERAARGLVSHDKQPLDLYSELSVMAENKLDQIINAPFRCPSNSAYPYHFETPVQCCPDVTTRRKCVNEYFGVNYGGFYQEKTAEIAVTVDLDAPLTLENMGAAIRNLLSQSPFSMLLSHPRPLTGMGVVTSGRMLVIIVSENLRPSPSDIYEICYAGTPSQPTTTVAPGQTTTVAQTTTTASKQTTTVAPGQTTTVAQTTTTASKQTTTVAPGQTTTVAPGQTTTVAPGQTTTVAPGQSTTVAQTTTQAPGQTTTVAQTSTSTGTSGAIPAISIGFGLVTAATMLMA